MISVTVLPGNGCKLRIPRVLSSQELTQQSFTMDRPDQSRREWFRDETRPLLNTGPENALSRENYPSRKSSKKSWSTTLPMSVALFGILPSLFFRGS